MPDCPFRSSDFPCEIELELMVQNEAVEEATAAFREMQKELCSNLQRIKLLETILCDHGIPIPDLED